MSDHQLRDAFWGLSHGRMAALEPIWREWSERLHNYAYALTGNQDEADDILGDVMANMARQGWRLVRNPRAYLFTAIRNTARSRARRAARRTTMSRSDPPPIQDAESAAVREAVLALPAEQREVVVLHVWGGLTLDEIGRTVGVSPNTAASRYRYALAKLRESLGGEGNGPTAV
jgi:RNA polymerase sigma-70 factor (ECF subfamily)